MSEKKANVSSRKMDSIIQSRKSTIFKVMNIEESASKESIRHSSFLKKIPVAINKHVFNFLEKFFYGNRSRKCSNSLSGEN